MKAEEFLETMTWGDEEELRKLIRLSRKQGTWNADSGETFLTLADQNGVPPDIALRILNEELG
jgi:hypothetical protein